MGPGLYVHVPFCVRKCAYCAFYSHPPTPGTVHAWIEGIARDLASLPVDFHPATLFMGGGTPTALEAADLARLLDLLRKHISPATAHEWTCEVNPGTLTPEKASMLRSAGLNRLSIGAQSFDDAVLRLLGRIHTAAETRECVAIARAAGFDNIGLDLIYGVPAMPVESVQADVAAALELGPEHISAYCLEIEPDTPLARQASQGRFSTNPDDQRTQFDFLRRRLAAAGFIHYEISNFARPGRDCRHNQLYWCGGEYIGIGPAAHSHWRGARWSHTAEMSSWTRTGDERLESEPKARETLVMGLRRLAGWRREEFRAATGFDYDDLCGPEIARLATEGLLVATPHHIRLADQALFVSDTVFATLI